MIRVPTRKRKKKGYAPLNLVPIMDAVFIFIFFLIMSSSFVKMFEIQSDVPIISDAPPPLRTKKIH